MKKRKLLFKQRCARSSYYLAIKLSPGAWKSTYTSCNKVPSPLKAPTRMYAILLFIFIPKGMNQLLVAVIKLRKI
jgi:hypothetical protein